MEKCLLEKSYTLLPISIGQQDQWDDFVAKHPQGHLLQSWGWGELKGRSGWVPLRLGLWDNEKNLLVAGAQVLLRTAPHIPLRAGHLAYIPKGPLLDWSQAELVESFFAQLHAYLAKRGAIAVRMELGQETLSPEMSQHLPTLGFAPARSIQPQRTILVDLAPDEEVLLKHMKKDCRYNVRMSARRGVTVKEAETAEEVRAWYQLIENTSSRKQFGIHSLQYYLDAWQIFAPRGQARFLLAYYEGQLLAGIFVAVFAGKGYYLYAGSGNEHRQLVPNYLLLWEGMRWAKREGATEFDLWGIPATEDENDPMSGVYKFKSEWGGRVTSFAGSYEYVYRVGMMKLARRFISF
jgi:peptidoglycan pentaglycine glycine transferase (the first glycine)